MDTIRLERAARRVDGFWQNFIGSLCPMAASVYIPALPSIPAVLFGAREVPLARISRVVDRYDSERREFDLHRKSWQNVIPLKRRMIPDGTGSKPMDL